MKKRRNKNKKKVTKWWKVWSQNIMPWKISNASQLNACFFNGERKLQKSQIMVTKLSGCGEWKIKGKISIWGCRKRDRPRQNNYWPRTRPLWLLYPCWVGRLWLLVLWVRGFLRPPCDGPLRLSPWPGGGMLRATLAPPGFRCNEKGKHFENSDWKLLKI